MPRLNAIWIVASDMGRSIGFYRLYNQEVNDILPETIVPHVEPKTAEIDTTKPGSAMLDVLVEVPRVKVEVRPSQVLVKW